LRWRRVGVGLRLQALVAKMEDRSMEAKEHYLMLLMFARMHECLLVIRDTLKSRDLWTDDDEKAFSAAVALDSEKLRVCMQLASKDYLRLSSALGVATGLEDQFPD
jgi:hypothetical protein